MNIYIKTHLQDQSLAEKDEVGTKQAPEAKAATRKLKAARFHSSSITLSFRLHPVFGSLFSFITVFVLLRLFSFLPLMFFTVYT